MRPEEVFYRITLGKPSDCWPAKLAPNSRGCVCIRVGKDSKLMHRVVYELVTGIKMTPDLYLVNTCGLLVCMNPRHYELTREHPRVRQSHARMRQRDKETSDAKTNP